MNNNEYIQRYLADTQIGLLGGKYSMAPALNLLSDAHSLTITNLMLYLTNVNSHDFFLALQTLLFSVPGQTELVQREISVPR